ncbi:hypothetical protein GGX14DRAFT_406920 [Mycena pura]|uniref:Uncharacterized protein n=1 Tax=Mycena pura TaxID=153505 RepID=A0AAD6XZC3_9AGAR|nr:hypothetical protein GGX14DRAFT_406920 [Mycena pura]
MPPHGNLKHKTYAINSEDVTVRGVADPIVECNTSLKHALDVFGVLSGTIAAMIMAQMQRDVCAPRRRHPSAPRALVHRRHGSTATLAGSDGSREGGKRKKHRTSSLTRCSPQPASPNTAAEPTPTPITNPGPTGIRKSALAAAHHPTVAAQRFFVKCATAEDGPGSSTCPTRTDLTADLARVAGSAHSPRSASFEGCANGGHAARPRCARAAALVLGGVLMEEPGAIDERVPTVAGERNVLAVLDPSRVDACRHRVARIGAYQRPTARIDPDNYRPERANVVVEFYAAHKADRQQNTSEYTHGNKFSPQQPRRGRLIPADSVEALPASAGSADALTDIGIVGGAAAGMSPLAPDHPLHWRRSTDITLPHCGSNGEKIDVTTSGELDTTFFAGMVETSTSTWCCCSSMLRRVSRSARPFWSKKNSQAAPDLPYDGVKWELDLLIYLMGRSEKVAFWAIDLPYRGASQA